MVELFTHLNEKDFFREVYKNLLSRRLLNDKSESIDLEKNVIIYLKLSCGAAYTRDFEGMLNDLNLAGDVQKDYEEKQGGS